LIPHHQRDYLWREDEVDQLLEDVYDARTSVMTNTSSV
jgi:uncharacterized protein with ParB-like and HNH nuclease domain